MQRDGYLRVVWTALVLILTAGAAQSDDNQTPTSMLFGASQDILFVGTLQNGSEGDMPGAPDYWIVEVNEVLLGPKPCSEEIRLITYQATPPPWGTVDEDVKAGDKVWINGRYIPKDSGCEVTLQGSNEYYLRKYPEEIKLLGTAVAFSNLTMPGSGPRWNILVDEVLSGPQACSDRMDIITSAALFPAVWGSVEPDIVSGDRIEVFGAYQANPGARTCSITLYGSKDYYIRKAFNQSAQNENLNRTPPEVNQSEFGILDASQMVINQSAQTQIENLSLTPLEVNLTEFNLTEFEEGV